MIENKSHNFKVFIWKRRKVWRSQFPFFLILKWCRFVLTGKKISFEKKKVRMNWEFGIVSVTETKLSTLNLPLLLLFTVAVETVFLCGSWKVAPCHYCTRLPRHRRGSRWSVFCFCVCKQAEHFLYQNRVPLVPNAVYTWSFSHCRFQIWDVIFFYWFDQWLSALTGLITGSILCLRTKPPSLP